MARPTAEISADTYRRQILNNLNRNYRRWLVIIDVLPDAGAIEGFEQIVLPFRTLNVIGKRTLTDALKTIMYAGREMRFLAAGSVRPNSVPVAGVRYRFCLIDMTTQQTVDIAQVQDWAANDSLTPREGDTPEILHADLVRAVIIANGLTGLSVPRDVMLDNNDPIKILRVKQLFPLNPATNTPSAADVSPDVFAGAVSDEEYTAAIKRAHAANNNVWIAALPTLPSVLDVAIERAVQTQSAAIIEALMRDGVPDSSPRLALVRLTLERAVAKVARPVYRNLYHKIVTGNINFLDQDLLDGVVLAALTETAWHEEDLPRFLRGAMHTPASQPTLIAA